MSFGRLGFLAMAIAMALVACDGDKAGNEICGDGLDNDFDGLTDCADLECATEAECVEDCDNGDDDDGDGDVDCDDSDCEDEADCAVTEPEDCNNGQDDDDDGDVDCEDSECDGDADCVEDCNDGADNDGDGNVDCDDSECSGDPDCQVTTAEDCDNNRDDDLDGDTDCDDTDCAADPACVASPEDCDNGRDDDLDDDVDCSDSDCASDPACIGVEDCNNGSDDDGDSDIDCNDSDCLGDPACGEVDCRDGVDNDSDGYQDCADPDCAGLSDCYYYSWTETGQATIDIGNTYDGTATHTFTFVEPPSGGVVCEKTYEATSTDDQLASCSGCDFAFTVTIDNGVEDSGDCTTISPVADANGNTYGYGFDPAYDYGGTPVEALMYYVNGNWYSMVGYGQQSVSFDGTNFDYEVIWGYFYYN